MVSMKTIRMIIYNNEALYACELQKKLQSSHLRTRMLCLSFLGNKESKRRYVAGGLFFYEIYVQFFLLMFLFYNKYELHSDTECSIVQYWKRLNRDSVVV